MSHLSRECRNSDQAGSGRHPASLAHAGQSRLILDPNSLDDYRTFLAIKRLPSYRIRGCVATFPAEYAERIGRDIARAVVEADYDPPAWHFDYQAAITRLAIRKRKFSTFIECGLGKTGIILEYAKHVAGLLGSDRRVLIVSPLMVVKQTIDEAAKFYGGNYPIEQVKAAELQDWLDRQGECVGITNYEAIRQDIRRGRLGCLILDESSMLKSHYGKWGTKLIELGRGLEWKLCCTGTPAPNDRIEYGNHAVFMDAFPNVNAFLAKFFVNRGQTSERWELKSHALRPFYLALSHWCIFVTNPATYGWRDNAENIPPIHVHDHEVPLTDEQVRLVYAKTGRLIADKIGGITSRSVLSQIAKGSYKGQRIASNKPGYVRELVDSWPDESSLVWCKFNAEQELLADALPDAASLEGSTPMEARAEAIAAFKAGQLRTIISKPEILGFGLNLQKATRQVFSACDDSYEDYHQCVKRSNRVGSTRPLNVHIPVTEIERPLMENVLRKAAMVQRDTEEQEAIFRAAAYEW